MFIILSELQGAFLEKIKSENPETPCFLFGHSTGGAVVLKVSEFKRLSSPSSDTISVFGFLNYNFIQAASNPLVAEMVKGIILTSPALRVKPAHPIVGVSNHKLC